MVGGSNIGQKRVINFMDGRLGRTIDASAMSASIEESVLSGMSEFLFLPDIGDPGKFYLTLLISSVPSASLCVCESV